MLKEVEEFERLFTKALSERNLEVLVQLFRPPLPVFYPDGIKVDSGFPDISDGLSFLLDGMKKAGIVKAESEIMKVERRKGTGTISYLVTTRMLNSAGECMSTAVAKRFIEKGKDGYRITMLDIQKPAIGILNGKRNVRIIH